MKNSRTVPVLLDGAEVGQAILHDDGTVHCAVTSPRMRRALPELRVTGIRIEVEAPCPS